MAEMERAQKAQKAQKASAARGGGYGEDMVGGRYKSKYAKSRR
jgi:hypothetical protein